MTKAELLRSYILKHPDATPTALVEIIRRDHKDIKLAPQEISTLRGKMRQKGELPDTQEGEVAAPAPAAQLNGQVAPALSLADKLARLKEAVEAVGGIDEARRILDMLK